MYEAEPSSYEELIDDIQSEDESLQRYHPVRGWRPNQALGPKEGADDSQQVAL